MKFKLFISLVLLAICMIRAQAGMGSGTPTNALPGTPLGVATNATPKDGTNAITAPKTLEDKYTNSVGMELLKVGGFWAGKFEVTQKQYQQVMGSNPSGFSGDTRPVDNVSWNDAQEFCQKMTARDLAEKKLPEGYYYALPTEPEWESLVADATVENSVTSMGAPRGDTMPVGSKAANSLGLFDVRGNVQEFTVGDSSQAFRVLRGGSWQDWIEVNLRVEFRTYCQPEERKSTFGFRCLVRSR